MTLQAVTPNCTRILDRVGNDPVTLYNPNATTVIYVDNQNPASTSSQPINPGAQLVWTEQYVYAVTAPGETGNLLINDNQGDLNDPTAIATAIIDQGLAEAIAAALQITTVPAGDNPTLLEQQVNVTAHHAITGGVTFDCSKYQSLIVIAMGPGAGTTGLVKVGLTWGLPGSQVGSDVLEFEQEVSACLPCRGTTCELILQGVNNDVANVSVYVFGSFRSFPSSIVDLKGDEWGSSGVGSVDGSAGEAFVVWQGVMPAGTSHAEFPPSRSGRAVFTFTANDTATEWSVWVADYDSGAPIAPLLIADTVTNYSASVEFIAPRRPLLIHVNNLSGANQNFSAAISYED